MISKSVKQLSIVCLCLIIIACNAVRRDDNDGAPDKMPDVTVIPDAVMRDEPRSRYGNPEHYEVFGKRYYTLSSSQDYYEQGIASWYGTKFHGRRTSSGEIYDMYAMTAAHKTLPLPTYVEVINLYNDRKVVVKVNDRGPFHGNRLIDLSYSAALKLGIVEKGTAMVSVRAVNAGYKMDNQPTAQEDNNFEVNDAVSLYLQVGAFSRLSSANQLKNRIQQYVDNLVIVSTPFDGKDHLYRVRIGVTNIESADLLASRLLELGFNDVHVVVE